MNPFSDVKYLLTIKTANQNRHGITGAVYAKISGDERKETKKLLVTERTIPNNSKVDFEIDGDDVGQPRRLFLLYEKTNRKWTVEYVKISRKDFSAV